MSFSIRNNVTAMFTQRSMTSTQAELSGVMERLSSGYRINKAADDAAGLAISEKLRAQVRGLNQASRNAQDGISVIQTAEAALGEGGSILQRMRELTVEAANDTLTSGDRDNIQKEVDALLSEVDRFASSTEFNTQKLISGSLSSSAMTLQIGANNGQTISFTITTATASSLGVSGIAVSSQASAAAALASIDAAITTVTTERAKLGSLQNRLERTISNLDSQSENLSASESRIRDTDVAKETIALSRLQILQQAGVAAQSQANSAPQAILSLLR
ncbi:MAG: flagellin FliC [Armatimonadetes bacterium]|nr:flagellin FliC [Armatimonadota bacterium]